MPKSANVRTTSRPDGTHWWLGVLSAPAAWMFVEGVGYVVSPRECSAGRVLETDTLRIRVTQLVICAVGLVVAINGLRVALSQQRALAAAAPTTAAIDGRKRFMAISGIHLSVLFIGGIVLFALSALFLDVCERII